MSVSPKSKKSKGGHRLDLATLLMVPEPPTRLEYAEKKVTLARKMDRLDFASKARLEFIRLLHKNNEQKSRMITSFNDKRLGEVCDDGLRQADEAFAAIKSNHKDMDSVRRRLKIIHDYCLNIEVSEGKGQLKASDLDPLPTAEIYDSIAFEPIIAGYQDYLTNKPSPFRVEGETRDPLSAVCLLQPYLPPDHIVEQRLAEKERAKETIAAQKEAAAAMKLQGQKPKNNLTA